MAVRITWWMVSAVLAMGIVGCKNVDVSSESMGGVSSDTSQDEDTGSDELIGPATDMSICGWICDEKIYCLGQDPEFEEHIAVEPDFLEEKDVACKEYCELSLTEGTFMRKYQRYCSEWGLGDEGYNSCIEYSVEMNTEWFFAGERLAGFMNCIKGWSLEWPLMDCDGGEDTSWSYYAVVYPPEGEALIEFETCKAELVEYAADLEWPSGLELPPQEMVDDTTKYFYAFDFYRWLVDPLGFYEPNDGTF